MRESRQNKDYLLNRIAFLEVPPGSGMDYQHTQPDSETGAGRIERQALAPAH